MSAYHRSTQFSWDRTTKQFCAEASMLTEGGRRPLFCQIYPDACDEGFIMVSDRTGKEAKFVVDSHDMNGDEIAGWRLIPTRDSVQQQPALAGCTVLVIND